MRNHLVIVLLSSLGLLACAGSNKEAESAANPWADFKGTYSTPAPRAEKADKDEVAKKESKAKTDKHEDKAEDAAPKKRSKATVLGESLSSVSVESLTDASKGALRSKFVSNSVMTGAQYELVQVQLKGASVQIVRPAEKPTPSGPPIASPKAKSSELSKSEASWYDEEADVLVVVTAGKKAAAQKALGAIVKR